VKLSGLVAEFMAERDGSGLYADDPAIDRCAIAAARFYAAYGPVASMDDVDPPVTEVTADTELTTGEWALIRPLFLLYVERIEVRVQEASAAAGHVAVGRSAETVAGDIKAMEEAIPHMSFVEPAFSVGMDDVSGA
jgi:hypothetical protein